MEASIYILAITMNRTAHHYLWRNISLLIFSYTTIPYYSKGLKIGRNSLYLKKKKDSFETLRKCRLGFPFITGNNTFLVSQFNPDTKTCTLQSRSINVRLIMMSRVLKFRFSKCSSIQMLVTIMISNYVRKEMIMLTI